MQRSRRKGGLYCLYAIKMPRLGRCPVPYPFYIMSIKPEGKALHFLCRLAVGLLSLVLVFGTAVPLLRSHAWWIRIFDFPRIQIAVLIGLTLAAYALLRACGPLRPWEYALAAVVGLGRVWQLYSIAPYTAL